MNYSYIRICTYHISLINNASLISTPVRYYSNTNNIEMVVIFVSSLPSNRIAYHLVTPDISYSKLLCNRSNFINRIQVMYNEELQ